MEDTEKLKRLSMLISCARTAIERGEPTEHFKKEFQEMLHFVSSVEMVREKCSNQIDGSQVTTKDLPDEGSLLQAAVALNMQDFARLLLEFGFVNFNSFLLT